jgi:hypothetical protein
MTTPPVLRRTELRYVLTKYLAVHGESTVDEMVRALERNGFAVVGRPSKVVSDALRAELERGRVYRTGRGLYRLGYLPRGTAWRIDRRVAELVERALPHRDEGAPDYRIMRID